MVAGVNFENRQITIEGICADERAYLVREPANAFSLNAILVLRADSTHIGYVPEVEAKRLAPPLNQGAHQAATIKRILTGHRGRIPVIWGGLYRPDSAIEGTVSPRQLPVHQEREEPKQSHTSLAVALTVIGLVVLGLVFLGIAPSRG